MAIEGTDGTQDTATDNDFPIVGIADPDEGSTIRTIDPETITFADTESDTPVRRGRGRPRGSKSTAGKQARKEVSQDLSGLLYSAHLMLASLTKVDEFKLDKEEAKELGDAIARVNSEFGGIVVSPKTAACVNLVMVGGAVYGTRLIAYNQRLKNESAARRASNGPQSIM